MSESDRDRIARMRAATAAASRRVDAVEPSAFGDFLARIASAANQPGLTSGDGQNGYFGVPPEQSNGFLGDLGTGIANTAKLPYTLVQGAQAMDDRWSQHPETVWPDIGHAASTAARGAFELTGVPALMRSYQAAEASTPNYAGPQTEGTSTANLSAAVPQAIMGNAGMAAAAGLAGDTGTLGMFAGKAASRELDPLGYYSGALEAAKALPQAKGTAEQMLAMLKKGGAKEGELQATGLLKYLGLDSGTGGAGRRLEGSPQPSQMQTLQTVGRLPPQTPHSSLDQPGRAFRSSIESGWSSGASGAPQVTRDDIIKYLRANRVNVNRSVYDTSSGWGDELSRLTTFEPDARGYETVLDHKKTLDKMHEFASEQGDPEGFSKFVDGDKGTGWNLTEGHVPVWSDSDGRGYILSAPNGKTLGGFQYAGAEDFPSPQHAIDEWRSRAEDTVAEQGIEDAWKADQDPGTYTKWSSYSLDPSNPTYRETVLHLPLKDIPKVVPHPADNRFFALRRADGTYFGNDVEPAFGFPNREQAESAARNGGGGAYTDQRVAFRSGHFPEPNIIGHYQSSIQTDANGNKVFVPSQIQSDWGQAIRDSGGAFPEDRVKAIRDGIADHERTIEQIGAEWERRRQADPRITRISDTPDLEQQQAASMDNHRRLQAELATYEQSQRYAPGGMPYHPLVNTTDQWVNTTLRPILRDAVESGADSVAIPSGKTVLSYNPGDEHGMEGFYNDIVPKNLRKLLQKMDPSIQPAFIETLKSHAGADVGKGFTAFPITGKVREAVRSGQPLFATAGIPAFLPIDSERR